MKAEGPGRTGPLHSRRNIVCRPKVSTANSALRSAVMTPRVRGMQNEHSERIAGEGHQHALDIALDHGVAQRLRLIGIINWPGNNALG